MASYKIVMVTGIIVSVLGGLLMTSNTIYHDNATRTFTVLAIKLAIVGLGILIYKKGEHMRDNR